VTSAAVCAEEGLRLAVETGLTNPATFHRAVLAWVAALRGDRALALTHAEQAADVARRHGLSPHLAVAGWAVGLLHLGSGEWEIAASRLEGLLQPGHEIGHPFIARRALPDLVEAAARADRPELARAAADRFENFGPAPEWELSLRARCRGLVSASVEERERLYREALALDERDPRPFARGRTLLLLGELLRRERRRAEARPHLRDAVDGFGRLGAVAWEKRARAELRATGETVRKLEPGTLEQLTPQQIQIARLVAAGATNKEAAAQLFLSPRTVDYHLRKVFIKLDIASRSELIRLGLADLESRPGIQPRWRGDGSGHVHRRDA
jgi:DNA-binding CsgD family transcriptional regulator